ncbi:MMPL family transporter [Trinickia sp. EG282A]|uniref:MMPL family transporter n=1 Tax=Trinickia sp. EG282A TaxID=3237013 RepID=UPI0034D2089A
MGGLRSATVRGFGGVRIVWLALALAAVLYCIWRFAGPSPLQTNLLALVPRTEADPIAERAVDTLASAMGDRTVFLVSSDDADRAKTAARQFAATLAGTRAFRGIVAELPPFDATQVARFYSAYRFRLLTDADRLALDGDSPALSSMLATHLYNPLRAGFATPLAVDPFGWLGRWIASLPLAASNLVLEDGMLVTHRADVTSVLVMADLPGSAYEPSVQAAVRAAVAEGQAKLRASYPDVRILRAGAVFYADAGRRASERDVHRIGIVSIFGIALLMLWIFRSPKLMLLGFASTALGIVCALAATMLVFGEIHLLTLVFGTSLIGEAVDYSIQYFVLYLGAGSQWDARQGARAVRPALAIALATSLLGYAVLAWMPFPALKQIACFAMTGIAVAFGSVLSLLPSFLRQPPRRVPRHLFAGAARLASGWHAAIGGWRAGLLAVVVIAAAVPGWLRLKANDDIHLLVQRDPLLVSEEQQVRDAIGIEDTSRFFLVKGATPEQVLERCETLSAALDAPVGGKRLAGWQSVSRFVPSVRRQDADRALLAKAVFGEPSALRATLLQAGFREDVADRYSHAFAKNDAPLTVDRWLAQPWSQPYRHLWLGSTAGAGEVGYAALVMPLGAAPDQLPALGELAKGQPGVVFVDKAASVSRLFGAYRDDCGIWLAIALVFVSVLLALRYGLIGGLAVMLPVALAIGVALAAFGYARVPLTLFNWLALMLVLGVGLNYAVFLREGCLRERADLGAVWTGVALSAATTLLSFGLLAASSMSVLKSFGATLALGISVSVLLAPIGMPPIQSGGRR